MELKLLKGMRENRLFRILAVVGTLFININSLSSQEPNPGGASNYLSASEINSRITMPKSPEATAFEKYGNTPVNLYTGTPDISIPLHTIKGRELDMPILLNYDASGIKVSQIATNVGLGWNLTMGGRITRIANGLPDDLPQSPYNHSIEITDALYNCIPLNYNYECRENFLLPVVNGAIDTQLDYYSLNMIGINDYIVRDLGTNDYHTLLNPKIKIFCLDQNNWIVNSEDDTKYYFTNVKETSEINGGNDLPGGGFVFNGISSSSWLLTKIISKNNLDIYEFDFELYRWANYFSKPYNSVSYTQSLRCDGPPLNGTGTYSSNFNFKTNQQMPISVKLNGEIFVKFNYKSRVDLNFIENSYQGGNAIDFISFYNFKTSINQPTVFKKIVFNHSYFGITNSNYSTKKRLKLDDVIFYGSNLNDGKKYSFEYIEPTEIPDINSFSQDYLGLNNGAGNSNLIPPFSYSIGIQSGTVSGANRLPNFETMTIGTLNKIIYPTMGYTTFEYEQNRIPNNTFYNSYTEIQPLYLLNLSNQKNCDELYNGSIFSDQNLISQHMAVLYQNNFNRDNCPSWGGTSRISRVVDSKILNVTSLTDIFFESHGEGAYIIQRLPSCNISDNIIGSCSDMLIPSNYNLCMRHPASIFFDKFSSSHPNDFIVGGLLCDLTTASTVQLPIGTYQITFWSFYDNIEDNPDGGLSCSFKMYKNISTVIPAGYIYNTELIEGFRIKNIKDFSSLNVISTNKEFKYIQNLINSDCSGVQLGFKRDIMSYNTVYTACDRGAIPMQTHFGTCQTLTSYILDSTGISTTPNIGYESVFEIISHNNNKMGYTQSKFHVGVSGLQNAFGEMLSSFEHFYKFGKISQKNIIDNNKSIVYKEDYFYNDVEFYNGFSFFYEKNHDVTYARAGQNGNSDLVFEMGQCSQWTMPGPADPPTHWGQHGGWYNYELGKYSYHPVSQNIKGKFGYLSKKETTTYPESGGEIKKSEEYVYNDSDYRLASKITKNSDTEIREETYTYHPDYPLNTEKITNISITDTNGLLTQHENVYTDYGTTTNGVANLVSEIKTAKGDNALESRLLLDYDSTTKNITTTISPTTASPSNDSFDSYIFGYNNMFPVAKLSGVKYSQISAQRLLDIKNLTNVAITPASELEVATELNKLRVDFPNAQITTYTYNPVIGVTSETNPAGDTKYYEYDELSRLKRVKDKNGNILTENEYKYKYN